MGFLKNTTNHFFNILGPHFLEAIHSIMNNENIPHQALCAIIRVIPKDGKDPSKCPSYRPISLLNTDLKLFAKVLYLRLVPHISAIIHLDQVGFVPKREVRDNTVRALNIIHKACWTD